MKIGYLVGKFPTISETFILNQVIGMKDNHDIHIYASNEITNSNKIHSDFYDHKLEVITSYSHIPKNKIKRILLAILIILKNILIRPVKLLKTLNFIKYKNIALNLTLLYTANNFWMSEFNPDILHCHFGSNGLRGTALKDIGIINSKIVVTFHGSDVTSNYDNKNLKGYYDLIFDKADICTTNTLFLKNKLVNMGCKEEKIQDIPVGIDTNIYENRNKNYKTNSKLIILSVTRLVEYKGIQYSIDAINLLPESIKNDILYYIVGDGDYKDSLVEKVNKLKLQETIKFEGRKKRKEVINYYDISGIFILPSIKFRDGREEAQGLVIQEAQAMKVPVITTDVGGISEGVLNKKTGFILNDKDSKAIADKIIYFYKNRNKIKEFGERARKFVQENYEIENLNTKLNKIYRSL